MRYLKAMGIGLVFFLFLNGIQAVSNNDIENSEPEKVVYIKTAESDENLKYELEKSKKIASIREVLEVNFRKATIEEKRQLAETIYDSCKLFDLDVKLVLAVIQTESSFNTTAKSHVGALGLMQVMPRTGWAMSEEMELEGFEADKLFDSKTNVMLGTYYLKKMLKRYQNLEHALLAYNAGPTFIDGKIAKNETLTPKYAIKVKNYMNDISKKFFAR